MFKSGLAVPKCLNLIIGLSCLEVGGRWSQRICRNGLAVSWVTSLPAGDQRTTTSKCGPGDGSLGLFYRLMPEISFFLKILSTPNVGLKPTTPRSNVTRFTD